MKFNGQELTVTEDDLKKIFALFTSCTDYEKKQIFDESSQHYFKLIDLSEEYGAYRGEKGVGIRRMARCIGLLTV
jgi:hypothetical protein